MWSGTQAEFQRLLKLIQKQYDPLLPEHIEESVAHPRKMLQMSRERRKTFNDSENQSEESTAYNARRRAQVNAEIAEDEQKLAEAQTKAEAAGHIQLTLSNKNGERREVAGTAEDLTDYLEGRPVHQAEFYAPSGSIPQHTIVLRAGRQDGLSLRVSSKDAKWALVAKTELTDEIKKQVPAWGFLRSTKALFVFYLVVSAIVVWLVGGIVFGPAPEGEAEGLTYSTALGLVYGVAISMLAAAASSATERAVPAFEIFRAGDKPRGRKLFQWLGGALLALVLGVIGNVISQSVLN